MKVNPSTDTRQVANWLNFLRQAMGIQTAHLAKVHGMRRSNLARFINSGGQPGSVALEKACRALLSLGLCQDGTLRPGLHRWGVTSAEMAAALLDLLRRNDLSWGAMLVLRQGGSYLMVQMGRLTSVFAELGEDALAVVRADGMLGRLAWITLDRDGDAATKTLWQNEDDQDVLAHFKALQPLQAPAFPLSPSDTRI